MLKGERSMSVSGYPLGCFHVLTDLAWASVISKHDSIWPSLAASC